MGGVLNAAVRLLVVAAACSLSFISRVVVSSSQFTAKLMVCMLVGYMGAGPSRKTAGTSAVALDCLGCALPCAVGAFVMWHHALRHRTVLLSVRGIRHTKYKRQRIFHGARVAAMCRPLPYQMKQCSLENILDPVHGRNRPTQTAARHNFVQPMDGPYAVHRCQAFRPKFRQRQPQRRAVVIGGRGSYYANSA